MTTKVSFEVVLLSIILFLLAIISAYFFLGKGRKIKGNNVIGLYYFLFLISISIYTLKFLNLQVKWDAPSLINMVSIPLLYLYVKVNVVRDFRLSKKDWILSIPPIVAIIYLIISLLDTTFSHSAFYNYSFYTFMYLLSFCFIFLALRLIKKYRLNVYNSFSNLNEHNANWLQFIIYADGLYLLSPMIWTILVFTIPGFRSQITLMIGGLTLFLYLFVVFWKILQNAHIMQGIAEKDLNRKYLYSNLPEIDKNKTLDYLKAYMEEKQAFLSPDIKLKTIADDLNIHARELSQIINEKLNKNFYDFINGYRIEYAKNILSNPPNHKMTILEVMYASGFNSKSSFNTAFKRITGKTPSEYKKKID